MTRKGRSKGWSYIAGEKGRNRVRVFERKTGLVYLEFMDGGHRVTRGLGHRDRDLAKREAEKLVAEFANPPKAADPTDLTVGELFDNYLEEGSLGKGEEMKRQDRRSARLWLEVLPKDRRVATLTERDALAFIRHRKALGDLRPGKKGRHLDAAISPRSYQVDIKFMRSAIRWGHRVGILNGYPGFLSYKNEAKGTIQRPSITDDEVSQVLSVASKIGSDCECMIYLAHETGHRIGSVRQIRWSDINFAEETIHWRAEHDKKGRGHELPLSPAAIAALKRYREVRSTIGETWIFPSPKVPGMPVSDNLVRDWWQRLETLSGLKRLQGRGWHAFRRKFASDLKHLPLVDVARLGGWLDTGTILKCYQQADPVTMRNALRARRSPLNEVPLEVTATPTAAQQKNA